MVGARRVRLGRGAPAEHFTVEAHNIGTGPAIDVVVGIDPEPVRFILEDRFGLQHGLDEPVPYYGRLAVIHVDGKPAVQLFEVVAP